MARSRNGQAISPARRAPEAIAELEAFRTQARAEGDLAVWQRASAVLRYVEGKQAVVIGEELDVAWSPVHKWLRWYEVEGVEGLRTRKQPGAIPRLTEEQRAEVAALVEGGPQAAGFTSGMWTGPMVGQLIFERYGVRYHNRHAGYVPACGHAQA